MAGLSLRGIKKSFGQTDILHGIDLDITDGEFVVFVGPSGCGKSTLLRIISGLETASAGTIAIGARDVSQMDPALRRVAMVFQSYALYPHMSVAENIGFGLRMNGMPKAEVKQKVDEAAAILHLGELLTRKPKELSGGQRQRVAIGRAIVRHPEVFLFDEPLSNLDAELRVQMRLEIARLHEQLDATMIYVTHDQVEAMTLADRIVVLRAGRVEQVGTPLELYDNPDNLFVAGFIGSPRMNFLRAELAEDGSVVLTDFEKAVVPFTFADRPPADTALLLGVRPEQFDASGDVSLALAVDLVEHLGGSSFAYASSDTDHPVIVEVRDRRHLMGGGLLQTGFNSNQALLFDARTGNRVR
tara:strand:+ start:9286 stop:10356 length:1071 start_codon:yes stop_codon:yes gene_type:complete